MRILVVDDEKEIVELLSIYLRNEDYTVLTAYNGREALDLIHQHPDLDLILLDIMMPEMDGMQVLEQLQAEGNAVPVIMLSAKAQDTDRIKGLMAGADDYVTKPFNPLEVIARIKSIARRQAKSQAPTTPAPEANADTIEIGPLIISKRAHEVKTVAGQEIQLTSLELDILYFLASQPGIVFSADEIHDAVWGPDSTISSKTVMVHVSHLRDKIEQATNGERVIQTVWGVGYKVEA